MIKLYLKVFKDSFKYTGRASRQEYWTFFFVNFVITLFLWGGIEFIDPQWIFGLIALFFWLITLPPSMSVAVRRLHDTGKTGWLLLLIFIPFIGQIILLIFLLPKGDVKENEYGDVPEIQSD
jgi:uncharacterized membrane protein YhaH (DUF805 family)